MIVARFALLAILAGPILASAAEPQWIWSHKEAATKAEGGDVAFRTSVSVDGTIESASVTLTADNAYDLFVNGRHVGSGENWMTRTRWDIKALLVPGRNVLAVRASNGGPDPAGLVAQVDIKLAGKETVRVASDASWKCSTKLLGNWARAEFDDSKWESAVALGEYGKTAPWGAAGAIVPGELAASASKSKNKERGLFDFKDGDRLVLLGSAFIERMQSNGYFELELISAFPDKNITVRNLGWSGDNVWGDARAVFGARVDGFKRLVKDVSECQPSVILVCYGENEAYAGEEGLKEFRQGFGTLLDALENTGARIVVATPRKHENVGKPFPDPTKYNADLEKYCSVMQEIAKEREHAFVDWREVGSDWGSLTENGIYLTDYGYWRLASDMALKLGAPNWSWTIDIEVTRNIFEATGIVITEFKVAADGLTMTATDRRLPRPSLAHFFDPLPRPSTANRIKPPLLRGAEMEVSEIRVRGLAKGAYQLTLTESDSLDTLTSKELHNGVMWWSGSPDPKEPVEKLLAAINEKNFLYFNRYRPQNETYLFLFRKHEQGNNAVEIPQFDPLIAAQEKIIAQLKKPPKQRFELRRVKE